MKCPFCKLIQKEFLNVGLGYVVIDSNPALSSKHYLVLPLEHKERFDLRDRDLWYMVNSWVAQIRLKNYRLILNYGTYKHIKHAHLHIIGGKIFKKWKLIDKKDRDAVRFYNRVK